MSDSTSKPRTYFSGKSAPEDQRGINPGTWLAVVFALLSPIGALVAFVGYLLFSSFRFSWRVIAGATTLYAAGWALFGGASPGFVYRYTTPWREMVHVASHGGLGQAMPRWLLLQTPLSILLGGVFASLYSGWKWFRRPSWEDYDRLPTPMDWLRRRRAVAAIESDTRPPVDGLTVGVTQYGHRVAQEDDEGKAHTLVAGGSGAGKTTTMLIGMRDVIRLKRGLVVVDLKGGPDVPAQLAEWAARYGRKFLHWSITDPRAVYMGPADGPAFYDPIGRGDPSRRKDLIIGSQKWDVEYYKTVIANYLQLAFRVGDLVPDPNADSFTDLGALLDTKRLGARAAALFRATPMSVEARQAVNAHGEDIKWWEWLGHIQDPDVADLLNSVAQTILGMEESERSGIRNMSARLQTISRSTAGAWLKRDPNGQRDIDLRRAADEGWVVVFSLDSSNYEETSAQVAGLIIQDLKTLSSELRQNPAPRPLHVYIDEFAAVGSDNILGLLNKARDAKIPVTLSTQALADLKRADAAFVDQVLGIVNCFMIHRANTEHDAEIFAGLTGKKKVYIKRMGVEQTSGIFGVGTGAATGHGMIQEDEAYRVLPRMFQDLGPGELVYIANAPNRRVEYPVQVVREDPSKVTSATITASRPETPAVDTAPAGQSVTVEQPVSVPADSPFAATTPVAYAPVDTTPRTSRRVSVPDINMTAPAKAQRGQEPATVSQESVAAPQEPAPAIPSGEREVDTASAEPQPHRQGPPLIDPAAFRSRAPMPPAPPARPAPPGVPARPSLPVRPSLPARPAQPNAAAADVPRRPVLPPRRPAGLPPAPPAPPAFTAPWLSADTAGTDEFGHSIAGATAAEEGEESAFGASVSPDAAWPTGDDTLDPAPAAEEAVAEEAPDASQSSPLTEPSNVPRTTRKTAPPKRQAVIYDENEW